MGDGVEVEFCGGVLLAEEEGSVDRVDGHVGASGTEEACEGGFVEFFALAEAEAPGLYETADAAVESTVGVAVDPEGFVQDVGEEGVEGVGEVGVDAPQK